MAKGRVYWLTGLSNSGKTTIGTALYYDLKKTNDNVVILDGDIMKDITSENKIEEYSDIGRRKRAKRYSTLSKLLSDQGIIVIVCTISMYDEIRHWNRNNIKGYVEIFLDTPDEVLRARDKKGLYRQIDKQIQLPKSPDLTFKNDETDSVRTIVRDIREYVPHNEEDFDRDRTYWNQFYAGIGTEIVAPSQFARDIVSELRPGMHLLELGCGNGRDSLYFLKHGIRVTALDASDTAVDKLNELTSEDDNALFVCDNFVKCKSLYQLKYDYIYSRFTLHAITEEQEDELLSNISEALNSNGRLYIEARTIHDEIYGLGKQVGKNAFVYNNHYRRFIDVPRFKSKIENMGFHVNSIEERSGFSKTRNSDPVLMRCIASRCDAGHGGGYLRSRIVVIAKNYGRAA